LIELIDPYHEGREDEDTILRGMYGVFKEFVFMGNLALQFSVALVEDTR